MKLTNLLRTRFRQRKIYLVGHSWGTYLGMLVVDRHFTGRDDYCDPFVLTEQYFSVIGAPEKRMVWFEESAHFPFYEQPAAFAARMREVLRATSCAGDCREEPSAKSSVGQIGREGEP